MFVPGFWASVVIKFFSSLLWFNNILYDGKKKKNKKNIGVKIFLFIYII